MSFNSLTFLVFFLIVLVLYYLIPHKYRYILLLIASYIFYGAWNAWLIFLIFGTTLVSYIASRNIENAKNKHIKVAHLVCTLILCLGALIVFKYLNLILDTYFIFARLFGYAGDTLVLNIILPVGISFYTFQTLSYVIDVYKGKVQTEHNFLYYALYVSYFPQLVAGPIERPEHLLPQLKEEHKLEKSNLQIGLIYMLIGFFKKVVIADTLSKYVDIVYANLGESTGLGVILATILFAVQIYCDFDGYSTIAIGVAKMMGIDLVKNFDKPYEATTIQSFWRKWHISLTSWLTDYVYIPLGGNRKGRLRKYFNIFIVFLISGIWHGANYTFILWGVIHGLLLIIYDLIKDPWSKLMKTIRVNQDAAYYKILATGFTFIIVCFTWIFFRCQSLQDVGLAYKLIFTSWDANFFNKTISLMQIDWINFINVVLLILSLLVIDNKVDVLINNQDDVSYGFMTFVFILIIATCWYLTIANGGESSFIYFQF